MLKAIIIEDERNSRELLSNMINNYCEGIQLIGEAVDVESGVKLIQKKLPDLVLLDIEIKGGTGFDLLDKLRDVPFSVIFVTGYDQYAIKAIKYAALDYILKPIDLRELRSAIKRAKEQLNFVRQKRQFLLDSQKDEDTDLTKIILSDREQYTILNFAEIIYLKASGGYVEFILEKGFKKIASYSLKHYEALLPESVFFRIHHSYLINLTKVESYESGRTGNVMLKGGHLLNIAARRKVEFTKKIKFS